MTTLQTVTGFFEVDAIHTVRRSDNLVWLIVRDTDGWLSAFLCAARNWSRGRKHTSGYEWLGFRDQGKRFASGSEAAALAYVNAIL